MIISNILNKINQKLFIFIDAVFCPKENTYDILRAQFLLTDDRICINCNFYVNWIFKIWI